MKLLLLFLLLFALYTNIVSISIFVKISWRDNGEHGLDYHKYLASKKTGRFHLALNSHYHQNPIIQVTDGYDTYHFNQNEFQSPDNEPSNFNLQIAFNGHDLIIGEINNIEDNSIIYIIPRLDNTKYIKVTKDIVNDYFEQMINLFKHPVRILQFIWNRPMKSDNPIDVRIGCKSEVIKNEATTHSISSLNTKVYRKVDGIDKPYQSTYYVRSRVCPNDQYSVMLLGIHMNEWLYCDHAILSPNYVNTYYVNFYDLPNKPYCKLRVSALKIADKFIDKLSDNEKAVDQRMKDLFPDNIGIVIHGGWTGNKSGFQILSLSSGNVLEKSQQRQLALGRPPTYPKANLMLPSVLAHPQSPSIPVPGTTSTPDFGSTQKKIDIENLPPDELLRKNRLFFKTLKQNSNIGDNSNGINIANQQINDLQQPQPTPILPQHLPHVQNIIAQSYLNPRKENNSQYPRKPPLHVIKQNQPIPSRLGTNQQQIITPTVAQNQQQHTQHDITPIPFSQMDSQNQKQMLQQHVETNNPFHPSSDYNQQTNRSDTGIPPSSIGGENHQQMHQQHHVGTDHPLGLANALNQKQIHQQAHVGTNHPFHLEQHNEDDAIVEKRILEEYEHMPQNGIKNTLDLVLKTNT
ncbi:unnamed protein product [Meloidogyne enterolobii]|uniref:Uncharacterized protein n=1 Tax=Meloidogyne enterolobii TaxID=390850 RepID=A0ACB1ASH6_MELEN